MTATPRPVGHGRSPHADSLAAELARLAARHSAAEAGREHSHKLSAVLDGTVSAATASTDQRGWAAIAVGGYGRRELCPRSDVDIVFLCSRRDDFSQRIANALFYCLWDAGLDCPPSVRTVDESVQLASDDLSTMTSYLSTRFLAGDEDLAIETRRRILTEAGRRDGRALTQRLRQEREVRLSRAAEALYGLEPNLKEGRGGLRDLHEVLWAAAATLGTTDLDEIARQGFMGADEVASVLAATDYLLGVRNRLHYLTGRRVDRLHFAHQEDVARFLGYDHSSGFGPVVQMMKDLNSHADRLARAADGFWEHLGDRAIETGSLSGRIGRRLKIGVPTRAETAPVAREGRLSLPDQWVPADPAAALAVLAEAGRLGVRVGHDYVRQVQAALNSSSHEFEWTSDTARSLLDVLRAGDTAAELVEAASASGLLSVLIPEWDSVRYLAHRDVYHLHTVDHHSALVVAEISRLRAGTSDADAFTVSIADDVRDFDPLLVAALLHDIGKGATGDHSETGAAIASGTALRTGLAPSLAADAEFLVRHHLALARAATRRDLEDPQLIAQLATTIGAAERLRMLYLLTVADSRQTGPSAWTDWKATLVRDLTLRLLTALKDSNGIHAHNLEDRVVARLAELRRALAGTCDHDRLDEFLANMPSSYLLSQTPEQVGAHLRAIAEETSDGVRSLWARSPDGLHDELTVIAEDRPGLLWRVCGVFALHGVSILEARIHTGRDGSAIDIFRLDDAFESEISPSKRARIDQDLSAVLAGRLSLGYRLARKLVAYRVRATEQTVPTSVAVDNSASERYTIVEVRAQDRLGLLYTIARAMSDLQLDIHIAKLATRGVEAIDVFYVRDGQGQKAHDAEFAKEIERAILFELESHG